LRVSPGGLLDDFLSFGFLFESLCVRDMRVYAQANDGDVFHYRDKNGLEADLVIALRDGRWAAVEVKLGNKQIEEAAGNLKNSTFASILSQNGGTGNILCLSYTIFL
jgi:hypothetical protein